MIKKFFELLDTSLKQTLYKNIILYGDNEGCGFIKYYYKKIYNKDVKAVIDRWKVDCNSQVIHLMGIYYMCGQKDIIVNTLPCDKGPLIEFENIGEKISNLVNLPKVINLFDIIFENTNIEYNITFYDWMEYKYNIDIIGTIQRKNVNGIGSHGYYPSDFRIIYEIFSDDSLFDIDDKVFDFGCGKGANIITLSQMGYRCIGGVEYTQQIYNILVDNLKKLHILNNINVYLEDATNLTNELDYYNVFILFNPFSYELTKKVIKNILESKKRKKRKIKIVYLEPICHMELVKAGGENI